ncbi:MAG: hypothetical protein WAO08_11290, partial [Hyphomicrobiaceae bacterium]
SQILEPAAGRKRHPERKRASCGDRVRKDYSRLPGPERFASEIARRRRWSALTFPNSVGGGAGNHFGKNGVLADPTVARMHKREAGSPRRVCGQTLLGRPAPRP